MTSWALRDARRFKNDDEYVGKDTGGGYLPRATVENANNIVNFTARPRAVRTTFTAVALAKPQVRATIYAGTCIQVRARGYIMVYHVLYGFFFSVYHNVGA